MGYCASFKNIFGKDLDLIDDNGVEILDYIKELGKNIIAIRRQIFNQYISYSEDDGPQNLPILNYSEFLEIAQDIMINVKKEIVLNLNEALKLKEKLDLAIEFFKIAEKLNIIGYYDDVIVDA